MSLLRTIPDRQTIYSKFPLRPGSREIRVLAFKSASVVDSPTTAVEIDVQVIDLLSNPPPYVALSYRWGTETRDHVITCAGYDFEVTSSLYYALLRVQPHCGTRTLWVDQICINQEDDLEKSCQVGLMRDIYSSCQHCYMDLGERDDDVDRVYQHMDYLRRNEESFDTGNLSRSQNRDRLLQRHDSDKFVSVWSAFLCVAEKDYFSRIWIIQEMTSAPEKSVLCGPYHLEWQLLKDIVAEVEILLSQYFSFAARTPGASDVHTTPLSYLAAIESMFKDDSPLDTSLMALLSRTTGKFEATNSRDYMYALLGLAQDREDFPRPDYSKSPNLVFSQITRVLILQGHITDIFEAVTGRPRNSHDLPSWVPDWSSGDKTTSKMREPNRQIRTDLAKFQEGMERFELGRALPVLAVTCDVLGSCTETPSPDKPYCARSRHLLESAMKLLSGQPNHDPLDIEMLFRTLLQEFIDMQPKPLIFPQLFKELVKDLKAQEARTKQEFVTFLQDVEPERPRSYRVWALLTLSIFDQLVVAISQKGYAAFVSWNSLVGDLVIISPHFRGSYCIRAEQNGDHHLVGAFASTKSWSSMVHLEFPDPVDQHCLWTYLT